MANRYVVLGITGDQKQRLYTGEDSKAAVSAFEQGKSSGRYDLVNLGEGVQRGGKIEWSTIASHGAVPPSGTPTPVVAAVWLIALSSLLGVVLGLVFITAKPLPPIALWTAIFVFAVFALFDLFIIYRIYVGSPWGRFLYVFLAFAALGRFTVKVLQGSSNVGALSLITAAQWIVSLIVIVLLFQKSSNQWFRRRA